MVDPDARVELGHLVCVPVPALHVEEGAALLLRVAQVHVQRLQARLHRLLDLLLPRLQFSRRDELGDVAEGTALGGKGDDGGGAVGALEAAPEGCVEADFAEAAAAPEAVGREHEVPADGACRLRAQLLAVYCAAGRCRALQLLKLLLNLVQRGLPRRRLPLEEGKGLLGRLQLLGLLLELCCRLARLRCLLARFLRTHVCRFGALLRRLQLRLRRRQLLLQRLDLGGECVVGGGGDLRLGGRAGVEAGPLRALFVLLGSSLAEHRGGGGLAEVLDGGRADIALGARLHKSRGRGKGLPHVCEEAEAHVGGGRRQRLALLPAHCTAEGDTRAVLQHCAAHDAAVHRSAVQRFVVLQRPLAALALYGRVQPRNHVRKLRALHHQLRTGS
mmetsp:Transcript_8603/g.35856  ORF Transcript_8603/g.35856 Transcript_8603/m.35856 type:complete len:388 (+) Transcript_8603:362-1525(+)